MYDHRMLQVLVDTGHLDQLPVGYLSRRNLGGEDHFHLRAYCARGADAVHYTTAELLERARSGSLTACSCLSGAVIGLSVPTLLALSRIVSRREYVDADDIARGLDDLDTLSRLPDRLRAAVSEHVETTTADIATARTSRHLRDELARELLCTIEEWRYLDPAPGVEPGAPPSRPSWENRLHMAVDSTRTVEALAAPYAWCLTGGMCHLVAFATEWRSAPDGYLCRIPALLARNHFSVDHGSDRRVLWAVLDDGYTADEVLAAADLTDDPAMVASLVTAVRGA